MLEWISQSDFEAVHETPTSKHVDGLGTWFVSSNSSVSGRKGLTGVPQMDDEEVGVMTFVFILHPVCCPEKLLKTTMSVSIQLMRIKR